MRRAGFTGRERSKGERKGAAAARKGAGRAGQKWLLRLFKTINCTFRVHVCPHAKSLPVASTTVGLTFARKGPKSRCLTPGNERCLNYSRKNRWPCEQVVLKLCARLKLLVEVQRQPFARMEHPAGRFFAFSKPCFVEQATLQAHVHLLVDPHFR